jgi:hypothetical protein
MDHVLEYMKKEGLSLDVETYCGLNYSRTWAEVEEDFPEYREEVLDLVSEGELIWVQSSDVAKRECPAKNSRGK